MATIHDEEAVDHHAVAAAVALDGAAAAISKPSRALASDALSALKISVRDPSPPAALSATAAAVGRRATPAASGISSASEAAAGSGAGAASGAGGMSIVAAGTGAEDAAGPASPSSPSWRQDINLYRAKKMDVVTVTHGSKKGKVVKAFYARQNELIDRFEEVEAQIEERLTGKKAHGDADEDDKKPAVRFAINASFLCNVILFVIKVIAAGWSGSLAVVASAIDSSLDLLSGSILYCAARIAARRNKYKWPVGKSRLEPIAIVIFASVMGVAALQVIIDGIQRIVEGLTEGVKPLKIDPLVLGIIGAVIVVKSVLWIICYKLRNESDSVAALAQDHRNDVISNSLTLICIAVVRQYPNLWWLDNVIAMALMVFIIITWTMTGKGHVQQLTGRVAEKDQLSQITYLAMNHDARVQLVDTVRAYYIGSKLLVELDIVLPEGMPLKEAHDIGESLQKEVERLEYVERAFVHLDYEYEHREHDEHVPSA